MSLLKGLLECTRRVSEADMFPEEQVAPAPAEEVVPEQEVAVSEEPVEEIPEDIEITDELIAELAEVNPAISEADPEKLKAGLENEIKFLEVLGGDINVVANLVLAHINEFPEKDYYAALSEMENCLRDENCTEKPVEGEVAAEGELDADQPAFTEEEEVVEEGVSEEEKVGTDKVGTSTNIAGKKDTGNLSSKALSQIKNESATATHPDEKQDEKDQKKTWSKEKGQEDAHKAADKAGMNAKDKDPRKVTTSNETKVGKPLPGKGTTAEEKKDEADQKKTAAKEKAQEKDLMAKQKADDKVKDKA